MKTNFHSLNSTYNFCALKNLQFRFQEKNLNLIRGSNPQIFLLNSESKSKMILAFT